MFPDAISVNSTPAWVHDEATPHSLDTTPDTTNNTQQPALQQYPSPWGSNADAPGPRLVLNNNGRVEYRSVDPEFVPPALDPEARNRRAEMGLYYDLTQDCVSLHLWQQQLKEDLDANRRLLANRIAHRLAIVLSRIPSELERQGAIRVYLKQHIHDTYITGDSKLHALIHSYYNTLSSTNTFAFARDVRP
ncbi:hypothetical protein BDB00DRAFT_824356 [Zychaea mexicana]|uniref:uncharacterized protein n=1 Tax=Zychaea mexicana TaxID=64656 RepID=UPI0022FEFD94|nr:uncharacterized protein BDB00DRAFT_834813 [Zychaea mexicana]XP_052979349.1 uncharacterized protein BDB00DRAFT_824356 [Zychaea mexicana]KAI9491163.1 hypothetical protein BDB00DRAFT_834813 [Zychaea mexicana]KAI9493084.1 hypothetical protein BDB00DRAFT_824356 [Zychaea mexicana]